jgi:hypothetical protein
LLVNAKGQTMATVFTNLPAGTDTTLVAAVSGKIIRVERIVGGPSCDITLKSGSNAILPTLKSGSNANVDVAFADAPVVLARGEALVAYNAGPATPDIYVEYDVVD